MAGFQVSIYGRFWVSTEVQEKYKALSDKQRGYEERAKTTLKRFAETDADGEPPELPGFVWVSIFAAGSVVGLHW